MQDVPNIGVPGGKTVAHGGDLGEVRRRHPDAPQPWIDLSTGINPLPYPVAGLPADSWSRLPSHDADQALIAAAARRYRCEANQLVAAPGTQALIQVLPRLVSRSRVAIVGPTYAEHELNWRRHGHDVAVVANLEAADVVVVVNPDNPTGRLLPTQALRRISARLLVVDEAFIDLLPNEASLAGELPDNAIVLRSFGKVYGLAGVRLGFAIAPAPFAQRLREELGPWAVSGPALSIGATALADDAWLQENATRLAGDLRKLDALLVSAGFTVLGGTLLFRLASHPEAPEKVEDLARQGIHVRAFGHQPTWLRFGLPAGDEEFRRLSAALQVPQKVR
ncbi:L-threonine O-3-phosphate decarboxylase [Rhodospirillales bacterium URHD0017]|nr:L-threonine O-3-phosphate decarboxylase [Rhodospirillales bacterium URHD0017]